MSNEPQPVGYYIRIRKRKRVFTLTIDADYGEGAMGMRDGGKLEAVIIDGKKYFRVIEPMSTFPETVYEKEKKQRNNLVGK